MNYQQGINYFLNIMDMPGYAHLKKKNHAIVEVWNHATSNKIYDRTMIEQNIIK